MSGVDPKRLLRRLTDDRFSRRVEDRTSTIGLSLRPNRNARLSESILAASIFLIASGFNKTFMLALIDATESSSVTTQVDSDDSLDVKNFAPNASMIVAEKKERCCNCQREISTV